MHEDDDKTEGRNDLEARRKKHYQKKYNWHKENLAKMAAMNDNTCQECQKSADVKTGVIHHNQYTGNDYEKSLEKLISHNAIKWLCKTCHKKEHIAIHREDVNLKMKHSGFCALCDSFSWHAWFKVELGIKHQYGWSNFPLCDKCLKYLLKNKIFKKYQINGRESIYWGDLGKLDESQQILLEALRTKIDRDEFGDLRNLEEDAQQQGSLFE